MKDQKKLGISISYTNLALSTAINVFLTPFIISSLGDESYSLYKVMQSFAGPLAIFNMGVSTIVTRAIVKCDTLEEYNIKEKQNTIALALLASTAMAILVGVIGGVLWSLIPGIYGSNFSEKLIREGQAVFALFVISTLFHILTDAFSGCAIGHERYAINSSLPLFKNVFRVPLIIVALKAGVGVVVITAIDCVAAVVVFLISAGYALLVLKEQPRITSFAKRELVEMLSFSLAILLQAIVNQVNNNVDIMLLGALISDKAIITMYSSALVIYSAYNSMVSVMSGFFLPKATRLVAQDASGDELTDFVIRPGRYQAMLAVAIVVGFVLLGKDFISIWIGGKYLNAYYVALVLMVPVTIPLVENTAISILDASLKRIFRSITLAVMAIINVALSIILIKQFNFWGAALGTFISICIGHVFLMNWYYAKTFGMKIGRMFLGIFRGILPSGIVAGLLCFPMTWISKTSFLLFILKGVMFCVVYSIIVWKRGLQQDEKTYILNTLHLNEN